MSKSHPNAEHAQKSQDVAMADGTVLGNAVAKAVREAMKSCRMPERRCLRVDAAADYISLSPWKLRDLVTRGEMPVIQADPGSPWAFDVRDLDRWADEHKRSFPI